MGEFQSFEAQHQQHDIAELREYQVRADLGTVYRESFSQTAHGVSFSLSPLLVTRIFLRHSNSI